MEQPEVQSSFPALYHHSPDCETKVFCPLQAVMYSHDHYLIRIRYLFIGVPPFATTPAQTALSSFEDSSIGCQATA